MQLSFEIPTAAVWKTALRSMAGLGLAVVVGCTTPGEHSTSGGRSAQPALAATAPHHSPAPAAATIHAIADELWQYYQRQDYDYLQKQGIAITEITDSTFEQTRREADYAQTVLNKVNAVDFSQLNHQDWLTARVMQQRLSQQVEGLQYYWLRFDVVPYAVYYIAKQMSDIAGSYKLEKPADLDNYLKFVGECAAWAEQLGDKLEIQEEKRILLQRPAIEGVVGLFKGYENAAVKTFSVSTARLAGVDAGTAETFNRKLTDTIEKRLKPAYTRIYNDFDDDYRSHAPADVGLRQYAGGKEYYRFLVRQYLGPDVTPEQVHEIGLRETATAQKKMADVRKQLNYKGTQVEFHEMLRTGPRFNAGSAERMQTVFESYIKRLEPHIPTYFGKLPKAKYAIKRLDPALEATITAGYYQGPSASDPVGTYWFNGANPKQQSIVRTGPLLYHELVPGHHFQVALVTENEELPRVRKMDSLDISAYTEGWAEYAANYVAVEAGMYKDIWDQYALGVDESFVGLRLVVDTGMNYYDMNLEPARKYFFERSTHTQSQVDSDTLRYSTAIPAQALGYRMGYLKHVELRQRAERELGAGFDVRRYHDVVLSYGQLPLNILDEHINWFIAEEKKRLGTH